ncbi:lymphocyte-specific protein 1-like isoform X1 [Corythoichthys intestinalis]|uniref:lymphocyte-specific protein 1-like isoform X1 n=1 Tax=Corythoichthys intestinalis TaxID=161448 RepID=UPI0025A5EA19|nr:lymphocyte-specific protein 1-like isoform X1 [Corythoichthys intestinalis]
MSESIRRKSSSRQILQDLIQVTVQRSLEDAEEVERERRRRTRERQREEGISWSVPSQQSKPAFSGGSDEELGPNCCRFQEEDEGFSDWSHRLENRSDTEHFSVKAEEPSTLQRKAGRNDEKKHDEEQDGRDPQLSSRRKPSVHGKQDVTSPSCSKVVLSQELRQQKVTQPSADTTFHFPSGKTSEGVCMVKQEDGAQQILQREWSSEPSSKRATYEDDQDEENVNSTHEEMKERLADFDFQKSKEEGCKTDETTNRQSNLSVCSSEEDETMKCYGAMSPTFKKLLVQFYPDELKSRAPTEGKYVITERTESLRKSSNIKKTLPQPLCVSKIDKKLQQYTHALEVCTKDSKPASPALVDGMSPIAPKKNLFEAGAASNQNTLTNTQLKEIKPGGVLNKKNVWEKFCDLGSSVMDSKECSNGKKYKFVVMAHGKYEKVTDDDGCREDANWAA